MVPAAIADLGAVLRIEVKLAVRIALLFDPNFLADDEPPYELLVPIFGGHFAAEILKEFAIRGARGLAKAALRRWLAKEALATFKRIMLKYFSLKVTQRAVITKTIPIVGGVAGAAWNSNEVKIVGKRVVAWCREKELLRAP